MEKRDARLFQAETGIQENGWNIVELESRRHLRRSINELIQLTTASSLTTSELQQRLHHGVALFGNHFATQLVRSLHRDDPQECQSVVWLLTTLNDKATIAQLQHIALNERLPRSLRLSASLALAGMGATREVTEPLRRVRLYAIG
jgi:hypothetical protein